MKKRKDSFWGLHSDFHARPEYGMLGETLKEEEIREACRLLKPDYWQVDSKGHFGWASYPSALGNAMPTACDTLAVWRSATKAEDVAMFVHYSGVQDYKYCEEHPEEAVMNADGTRSGKATRLNGRYVDDILIPQISEMAERYGIDGAWVDGDSWGVEVDYHPETVAAFEKETGADLKGKLPVRPEDEYYLEYREFNRELFRRYLGHYLAELHKRHPNLQITSNWMYTDHALEPITTEVDYLSGDLNPWNNMNWARYAGRALAMQNMPWDLMAWGMRGPAENKTDYLHVHPTQLIQQAAAVIALGGGFQVDVLQHTDSTPHMHELRKLVPVAQFMRSREPYCFHGKIMHQAAMLLSAYDRKLEDCAVYSRGNCTPKVGLTSLLCEAGQSLEIVSEHVLAGHCGDYPLLIVPEIEKGLAKETVEELLAYAKNGGSLMLAGVKTCRIFAEAGAPFRVKKVEDADVLTVKKICTINEPDAQRYFTMDGESFGGVLYPVEIEAEGAEMIASTCYDYRGLKHPYAVIIPYGKGKIAAIGSDVGTQYVNETQYLHRMLMKAMCEKLYTPKARIEKAYGLLEIVCLMKDGRLMLQLVNGNGNHSNMNCATEDMIPPAVDIRISVACEKKPEKLILQPEGKELSFEYRDGRAYFEIGRLDMHCAVEVIV